MAKRVNSFADDFQQMTKTAESVVQIVKQQEAKNAGTTAANPEVDSSKAFDSDTQTKPLAAEPKESPTKPRRRNTRQHEKRQSREWGKPVSLFNTRIPIEMAELLDDLVYTLKKQGTPRTKQELAHEALRDLLRKYTII